MEEDDAGISSDEDSNSGLSIDNPDNLRELRHIRGNAINYTMSETSSFTTGFGRNDTSNKLDDD